MMKKPMGILIVIFLTACSPFAGAGQSSIPVTQSPTVAAKSSHPPVATSTPTAAPSPSPANTSSPTPKNTKTPTYRYITWMSLYSFITDDHTNWNQYIPGKYECVNYALDLVANAHRQNINAWIVTVDFANSQTGHAFVAFPTTDMGLVYIEPQIDYAYSHIEIGRPLCLAVDTSICENDWGKVVAIHQPVQCDGSTMKCWLENP